MSTVDGRYISIPRKTAPIQDALKKKSELNLGDDARAQVDSNIIATRDEIIKTLNRERERLPKSPDVAPWYDKLVPTGPEEKLSSGVDPKPTDLTRRFIDDIEENIPEPYAPDRLYLGQQEQLLRPSGLFEKQDFKSRLVKKTRLIAIDSRDRDISLFPQPTNFSLPLPDEIKNIQSLSINDIRFLNTLQTQSAQRGNINIILQEEGRNPLTVTIREGAQSNISSLLTELNNQLNQDPLFDLITKDEFYFRFQATGDYGQNFTYPKEPVFNEATGRFENLSPDDTKTLLVQRQFSVGEDYERLVFNTNETTVAYQYPVLYTAVEQGRITVTDELSNRIFNEFEGVSDTVILDYILSNSNVLDTIRYSNTYQFSLVNKQNVRVDANTKKIVFSAEKLADNLTLEQELQREAYIAQREDQLSLSKLTREARNTLVKQELAVTIEFADQIRTSAALKLGVNFLDYSFQDWADSNTVIITSSNPASVEQAINASENGSTVVSDNLISKVPTTFSPTIKTQTIALSNSTAANALVSDGGSVLPYLDISFNLAKGEVQVFDISMAFGSHGLLFSVVPFASNSPFVQDVSSEIISISSFRKYRTSNNTFDAELGIVDTLPHGNGSNVDFTNVILGPSGILSLIAPESVGKQVRLDTKFGDVSGDGADVYLHSDAGRFATDMQFIQGYRANPRFQALADTDASRNMTFDTAGLLIPPRDGTNLRGEIARNNKDALPFRSLIFQNSNSGKMQFGIQHPDINHISGTLNYRVYSVSDGDMTMSDLSEVRKQEDALIKYHVDLTQTIPSVSGRAIAGSNLYVDTINTSNWSRTQSNVSSFRPFTPLIRWTPTVSGQYRLATTISEDFQSFWFAPPQFNFQREMEGYFSDILRTAYVLSGGLIDSVSGGFLAAPPSYTGMYCPENHPQTDFVDKSYPMVRFSDSARMQQETVATTLDSRNTWLPYRRLQMITPDVENVAITHTEAFKSNIANGGSNSYRSGVLALFSSYAIGGKTINSGTDAEFGEENRPQYDPTCDLSKNRISVLAETDITLAFSNGTTSNHRFYAKVISLFNVAPENNTMFYACSPSQEQNQESTIFGAIPGGGSQNDWKQGYHQASSAELDIAWQNNGITTIYVAGDGSADLYNTVPYITQPDYEDFLVIEGYDASGIYGSIVQRENLDLSDIAVFETTNKNYPKTGIQIEAGTTFYMAGMLPTGWVQAHSNLNALINPGSTEGTYQDATAVQLMGSNAFEGPHFNRRRDYDHTYSSRPSGTLYLNTDLTLTLSCVYLGETITDATNAQLDSLGLSNVYTFIFNEDGEVKSNLRPIPIDWNLNASNQENTLESRAKLPLKTLRDISSNVGTTPTRYGAAVATSMMHTLVIQGGEIQGWGNNLFGQLGNNPLDRATNPNQSTTTTKKPYYSGANSADSDNANKYTPLAYLNGVQPTFNTMNVLSNSNPAFVTFDFVSRGFDQTIQVGTFSNIVKVSTSLQHSIAMDCNGAVQGWGTDSFLNTHDFNHGPLRSALIASSTTTNYSRGFATTISGELSGNTIRSPMGPSRLGTIGFNRPIDVPRSAKKWLNAHVNDQEVAVKIGNTRWSVKDPRLFSMEELAVNFLDPYEQNQTPDNYGFYEQFYPLPVNQQDVVGLGTTISREQFIWEATKNLDLNEPIYYRIPGYLEDFKFWNTQTSTDVAALMPQAGNSTTGMVPQNQDTGAFTHLSQYFASNHIGNGALTGESILPDNDLYILFGNSNLSFDSSNSGSNSNQASLVYGVQRIVNLFDNFSKSDIYKEQIAGPFIGVPTNIRAGSTALVNDFLKTQWSNQTKTVGLNPEGTPQGALLQNSNVNIQTVIGDFGYYGEQTHFTSNRTLWSSTLSNPMLSGDGIVYASNTAVDAAAGGDHTVILLDDGTVVACGDPRQYGAADTVNRYIFSGAFESNAGGSPVFRDVSMARLVKNFAISNAYGYGDSRSNTNNMVVLHHLSPARRVECTVGATYVITTSGYIRSAGKSIENGLNQDLFEGGCNLAVNDALRTDEFFVDIKTSSFNVVATTNQNRAFSWGFNLYGNISGSYATGGSSPYTDPSFNEIQSTDLEAGEYVMGRTADELIAFIQARKTADPLMRSPTGGDISFNAACMYPFLEYHNNLNLGPQAVAGGERVIQEFADASSNDANYPISYQFQTQGFDTLDLSYNWTKVQKQGTTKYPGTVYYQAYQSAPTDQRVWIPGTTPLSPGQGIPILQAFYDDYFKFQRDCNLTQTVDLFAYNPAITSDISPSNLTVRSLPTGADKTKQLVLAAEPRVRDLSSIGGTVNFNDVSWNSLSGPAPQVQQPEGLLGAWAGETANFFTFEELDTTYRGTDISLNFGYGQMFTKQGLYGTGLLEFLNTDLGEDKMWDLCGGLAQVHAGGMKFTAGGSAVASNQAITVSQETQAIPPVQEIGKNLVSTTIVLGDAVYVQSWPQNSILTAGDAYRQMKKSYVDYRRVDQLRGDLSSAFGNALNMYLLPFQLRQKSDTSTDNDVGTAFIDLIDTTNYSATTQSNMFNQQSALLKYPEFVTGVYEVDPTYVAPSPPALDYGTMLFPIVFPGLQIDSTGPLIDRIVYQFSNVPFGMIAAGQLSATNDISNQTVSGAFYPFVALQNESNSVFLNNPSSNQMEQFGKTTNSPISYSTESNQNFYRIGDGRPNKGFLYMLSNGAARTITSETLSGGVNNISNELLTVSQYLKDLYDIFRVGTGLSGEAAYFSDVSEAITWTQDPTMRQAGSNSLKVGLDDAGLVVLSGFPVGEFRLRDTSGTQQGSWDDQFAANIVTLKDQRVRLAPNLFDASKVAFKRSNLIPGYRKTDAARISNPLGAIFAPRAQLSGDYQNREIQNLPFGITPDQELYGPTSVGAQFSDTTLTVEAVVTNNGIQSSCNVGWPNIRYAETWDYSNMVTAPVYTDTVGRETNFYNFNVVFSVTNPSNLNPHLQNFIKFTDATALLETWFQDSMYFLMPEFMANAQDRVRMNYLGKSKLTYIDSYSENSLSNVATVVNSLQYQTNETTYIPEQDTLGLAADQDQEIVFNPGFTDTYMFNYRTEVTQALDYLGDSTWGNESNYYLENDLGGVGQNPQFGIDVSAGDFRRLVIRGTYPTNSQILKLRIVEGEATKTFGEITIAGLIEDIGYAQLADEGGSSTRSVLASSMGWRLLPRLMARTLQASTLEAADAYRITLLSGVIVDTLCGTLSGYRLDASGFPRLPDPPMEGVGQSGLTISGVANLAYPLDRVAAAMNIVSTDQLVTQNGVTLCGQFPDIDLARYSLGTHVIDRYSRSNGLYDMYQFYNDTLYLTQDSWNVATPQKVASYLMESARKEFTEYPMESLAALSNQIVSLVSSNSFQTLSLTEIMNRARVETVISSMAKLINTTYPDALRSNILRQEPFATDFADGNFTPIFKQQLKYLFAGQAENQDVMLKRNFENPFSLYVRRQALSNTVTQQNVDTTQIITLSGLKNAPYVDISGSGSALALRNSAYGPLARNGQSYSNAQKSLIEQGVVTPSGSLANQTFPATELVYPRRRNLSGQDVMTICEGTHHMYETDPQGSTYKGYTFNMTLNDINLVFPFLKQERLVEYYSSSNFNVFQYPSYIATGIDRQINNVSWPPNTDRAQQYQDVSGLMLNTHKSLIVKSRAISAPPPAGNYILYELYEISGSTSNRLSYLNSTQGNFTFSKSNFDTAQRVITQTNSYLSNDNIEPPENTVYSYKTFTESVELDVHVNINVGQDTGGASEPGANGYLDSVLVTICGMQSNYSDGLSNTTGTYTMSWDHSALPNRICLGAYQYAMYRREDNPDKLYSSNLNATKMYGTRDGVKDFCGSLVEDTRQLEACNVGYRTQTYFYPAEVITLDSVAISNAPSDTWTLDAGSSSNTSNAFANYFTHTGAPSALPSLTFTSRLLNTNDSLRYVSFQNMMNNHMYQTAMESRVHLQSSYIKDISPAVTISGILNGRDIVLNEDFTGSNCLLLSGDAHTFTSTISNLKLNTPELSENERLLLTGVDLSSAAISNVTSNLVNLSAVHITAKQAYGSNVQQSNFLRNPQLTVSGQVNYWDSQERSTALQFKPCGGVRVQSSRMEIPQYRNTEGNLTNENRSFLTYSYPMQASFTPMERIGDSKYVTHNVPPVQIVTYPTFTVLDGGEQVYSQPTRISRSRDLLTRQQEEELADISSGTTFEWVQSESDNSGGFINRITDISDISESISWGAAPSRVTLQVDSNTPIVFSNFTNPPATETGNTTGLTTSAIVTGQRIGEDIKWRYIYADRTRDLTDMGEHISGVDLMYQTANLTSSFDISEGDRLTLNTGDLSQMGLLTAADPQQIWDISHYRPSGGYIVNPDTFQNWIGNFIQDTKQEHSSCNIFGSNTLATTITTDLHTSTFPSTTDTMDNSAQSWSACGDKFWGLYGLRAPIMDTASGENLTTGAGQYSNQKTVRANLVASQNQIASNVLENLYGNHFIQSIRTQEADPFFPYTDYNFATLCGFIPLIDISARTIFADYSGGTSALDISASTREVLDLTLIQPTSDTVLSNTYDAFITFLNEVSVFVPKTTTVRFDPLYKAALLAFNNDFSGTKIFGTELLGDTGFGGKEFTLDGFSNSQDAYVTQQNTWQTLFTTQEDIRNYTDSNLENQIKDKYSSVFTDVSGFAARERFSDPVPFKINVIDSISPENLNRSFNWGLPQHLGFAKQDTDQAIRHISDNLFRLADGDFVQLNVNEELDTGTIDQAEGTTGIGGEIIGGRARQFAKMLLPTFGNIGTTLKQQQKDFDPIIRRLNKVNLRVLDKFGQQVDNDQCDFDMNIKITYQDVEQA